MKSFTALILKCAIGIWFMLFASSAWCQLAERDEILSHETKSKIPEKYVERILENIELAGDNAGEIVKILESFKDDTEKLTAAAFLVYNMSFPDLGSISASVVVEHIEWAFKAREVFPWARTIPEDIFLRYVLPYRVSQEPVQAWRGYFFYELANRVKDLKSMEEVALEVNRYCGEHVKFKPTEFRDQGVFETLKAGYGRCEEMMIVYICAARSVAIPARSCSTPWWPTCNSNHAWVEVWVDGKWCFLGACEPADKLDEAWFRNPVKRAAVVFSNCFGEIEGEEQKVQQWARDEAFLEEQALQIDEVRYRPQVKGEHDIIYRKGRNHTVVNTTGVYSDTCTVNVRVLDSEGRPVSGCPVAVSVFNYGALRPISLRETDSDGYTCFTLGIGDMFFSAGKGEGRAWRIISTRRGHDMRITLRLEKGAAPKGYYALRCPKPVTEETEAREVDAVESGQEVPLLEEEKDEETVRPAAVIIEIPAEHRRIGPDEFTPEKSAETMALIEESPLKEEVIAALKGALGNWESLAQAIRLVESELREDLLWLIAKGMSNLDRREARADIVLEHVRYANKGRKLWADYNVKEDMFRENVMNPRIGPYEHIAPWRRLMFEKFSEMVDGRGFESAARKVNEWVEANLSEKGFRSYFGESPNPLAIYASRGGDGYDISLVTVAILRSIGIPSRLAQNGEWVEFSKDGEWTPLYPRDPANFAIVKKDAAVERYYKEPGRIELRFSHKGLPYLQDEEISLSQWGRGYWIPLDRLNLPVQYDKKEDHYLITLPEGKYLVTGGIRNKSGEPYFYAEEVEIKSGEIVRIEKPIELPAEMMAEEDRLVRKLESLPELELQDFGGKRRLLSEVFSDSHVLLVFFNLKNEPSRLMLPLVQRCLQYVQEQGVSFHGVFIGRRNEELDAFLEENSITFPIQVDESGEYARQFGLPFSEETGDFTTLPSVILIRRGGEIVYWEEGYNLNIHAVIRQAIEQYLR